MFESALQILGAPVFRIALQLPVSPKTVENRPRSSTPRPEYGATRVLRRSPGSEAPPVSEEPHTDSPYRFSDALMLSLPQCLRRPASSEALSRLGDALQDS